MDFLNRIRLAAGVSVQPQSQINESPENKLITEASTMPRKAGQLHKIWIVLKPFSKDEGIDDILFSVDSINQLVHWINGTKRHHGELHAHQIFKSARLYADKRTATDHAMVRLRHSIGAMADQPGDIDGHALYNKDRIHHLPDEGNPWKQDQSEMDSVVSNSPADNSPDIPSISKREDELESDQNMKPDSLAGKHGLGESRLDYTDKVNSLTWGNEDKPVNVMQSVEVKTDYKVKTPKKEKDPVPTAINVPAELKSDLKATMKELGGEFQKAVLHDKNAAGYYPTAIEIMASLYDRLDSGTVEDIKLAQIELTRIAGHYLNRVPVSVINFLSQGGAPRSLAKIFQKLKTEK